MLRGNSNCGAVGTAISVLAATAAALAIVSSALAEAGPTPDPAPPVTTSPAPTTKPSVTPKPSVTSSSTSSGSTRLRDDLVRCHDEAVLDIVELRIDLIEELRVLQGRAAAAHKRAVAKAKAAARAKQARARAAARQRAKARAQARALAAKAAAERARKARVAALTPAVVQVSASTGGAEAGSSGSISLAAKLILGLAALLVLLAFAPIEAAYALGPKIGNALVHGRYALAGTGVAMAAGLLVAFRLGGAL